MESLQSLKEGIASGRLIGAKSLKLSDHLSEFPEEILALSDSLELLVLSDNALRSLPETFSQLKNIKVVFFNNNRFESFPSVLAQCPNLSMISFKGNQLTKVPEGVLSPNIRWLILTDNRITALPNDIGRLSKLQKLMLAGNKLRSLPPEMQNCTRLELVRLSANQLTELPEWIFTLPRLAWVAYAGNPFCEKREERALPVVKMSNLDLGEVLGQGASGVIYQAEWAGETVAVKLFKGEVTSDGLPLDEMRACIAAGNHPNLVDVLAKLDITAEKAGLIFSFISADYQNLGGPPSLDSCTRDTYSEETAFSLAVVLKIARGVAEAIAHLHARSILHGDLYAHNILINPSGSSILGDFGAASFFMPKTALALQRIESRAYGCLLEDLLDRCLIDAKDQNSEKTEESRIFDKLRHLQKRCMSAKPTVRPSFKEICETL